MTMTDNKYPLSLVNAGGISCEATSISLCGVMPDELSIPPSGVAIISPETPSREFVYYAGADINPETGVFELHSVTRGVNGSVCFAHPCGEIVWMDAVKRDMEALRRFLED